MRVTDRLFQIFGHQPDGLLHLGSRHDNFSPPIVQAPRIFLYSHLPLSGDMLQHGAHDIACIACWTSLQAFADLKESGICKDRIRASEVRGYFVHFGENLSKLHLDRKAWEFQKRQNSRGDRTC